MKVWVLQLGGWLPIQFSPVEVLLVDRNVRSALRDIMTYPERTDMDCERWWLDQLNSERFLLNSALCAFEGKSREVPSFEAFCDELERTNEILISALPKARLVHHRQDDYVRLYENVLTTIPRQDRETKFLVEVCPMLSQRTALGRERMIEQKILKAARILDIELQSLVVMATLSCLYEPETGSPPMIGRRILKPTDGYSIEKAYNALADIRLLEFLAATSGLGGPLPGLCTRDKYLAAFWVTLGISEPKWTGNKFSMSIHPDMTLFPRLDEKAASSLMSRLK